MKKQVLALLLCGTMALSLTACTVTDSGDALKNSTPPQQSEPAAPATTPSAEASVPTAEPSAPVVAPVTLESSGTLGDYSAEIKDFVVTKDYTGAPAIVITYTYTNNGEEAKSAMVALSGSAYQNGVELAPATIMDAAVYDAGNSMLDVKTGASLDIQCAYTLGSETAPVEFELAELISFSDDFLGKTFEIAPGGTTTLATLGDLPADTVTGKVGDYEVSIISIAKAKDYQGADCVTVTFGFKNNGTDAANFGTACTYKAYQDGIQLEHAIITDTTIEAAYSPLLNVKPGAAVITSSSFTTTSASDVEIEVEPLFSLGSDKVARTFTLG